MTPGPLTPARPAPAPGDTVWSEQVSLLDRIPRAAAMTGLFVVFVGHNLLTGGYMLTALWITTREVVYSFTLATTLGFSLGVLVGETGFGERAVMPYLVAIDTMPKIAFAPLFIAWLGFDISSKVALATFVATFPIVVGTAAGVHAAEENARMLFKTMGASRWQTLVKMKLPTRLPYLFTGLKIASVGVMAGAITGEFLGGGKGFGELIRVAASQLDTARVFSLIIDLSLLGLAMFGIVTWLQRRLVFWQKASVGGDGLA